MSEATLDRGKPGGGLLGLLVFGVLTAAASVVGALSASGTSSEYRSLDRPAWAPPSWLFGPVWTVLYIAIAVAGWLVWRRYGVTAALVPWVVQLALNVAWTPIFFGAGEYGWAAVDIVALWFAVGATVVVFLRAHRLAGLLLIPYWLWVAYASALNLSIWWNNR
ncbi:TspO/MBR family protein [Kribbella sp. NPDC048915]|uniref:TspO/MBR family protein n=1 Tax=Kribbella sp. NPDC048915 TaxID=3155148 RepID=UPI0033D6B6CB